MIFRLPIAECDANVQAVASDDTLHRYFCNRQFRQIVSRLSVNHRVPTIMTSIFQPIALRDLTLCDRIIVSPMCQYSAVDGVAQDWRSTPSDAGRLFGDTKIGQR